LCTCNNLIKGIGTSYQSCSKFSNIEAASVVVINVNTRGSIMLMPTESSTAKAIIINNQYTTILVAHLKKALLPNTLCFIALAIQVAKSIRYKSIIRLINVSLASYISFINITHIPLANLIIKFVVAILATYQPAAPTVHSMCIILYYDIKIKMF